MDNATLECLAEEAFDIKKRYRKPLQAAIREVVKNHPKEAEVMKNPDLFWALVDKCDELEERKRIDERHNQALRYMGG